MQKIYITTLTQTNISRAHKAKTYLDNLSIPHSVTAVDNGIVFDFPDNTPEMLSRILFPDAIYNMGGAKK